MAVELYQRAGSPYWYAYLKDPRQPDGLLRKSTKRRLKGEAQEVAADLQRQIDEQIAAERPPTGLTFIDAATHFIEGAGLKETTARAYGSLTTVIAHSCLGDFDLGTLTHDGVKRFVQERRKALVPRTERKVSDASIRRALSFISAVYTYSIDHQLPGAPAKNPLRDFDRGFLKESPVIDRHLRPAQFEEVLACCKSAEHRRILIVLVGTGMRSAELLQLRWDEIDADMEFIEFGNLDGTTKNKRSRRIPIHPMVREALTAQKTAQTLPGERKLRRAPSPYVFPHPASGEPRYSLGYLLKQVKARTGLKGYTNHGLRHTFASWAMQAGLDPIAVRDVVGHSTLSMTTRYARHVTNSVAHRVRSLELPLTAQNTAQTSGLKGGAAK